MTTLLESAFEKISALPEMEQNIYAKNLLEEIESEKKWDSAFSESEDILSQMADSALEDFKNSNTKPLTQDQL
ncbi:hypothetical protein MNB_SV-3-886 [hydrothermal vent metagenome]|uniref:Uncharacterized protein n=1 Tax=hydrothermal vent metagenome TaxID=652676 RepID=A0A1W1BE38_9ZZZZ